MLTAANYQQHRSAERRGWASPLAASRARHTPVAFNKHQGRSAFSRGRPALFLPVELGRAFGLGSLSRGWACTPDDLASFRTRIAAGLTPEQAGVLQSFPDQAGGQAAVGPEFQDHHLSSSVASDVKHHDASRGRKVGKAFQYGA